MPWCIYDRAKSLLEFGATMVQGELHPAGNTESPAEPSPTRVESFSDAVFAFGVTLLILVIRIPHPTDPAAGAGLLALLTQHWRIYLVYALSFMFVGNNWTSHRVMFSKFVRTNHGLDWLNLAFLMVAGAFIPLPTAVLGEWLGSPSNEVVAAVFYGAMATLGALLFNLLWWYGAYVAKLTSPEMSERERHAHTLAWAPAPFVVGAFTAVAFVNPSLAVAGYLAIVCLYLPPTPALMALLKRRLRQRSGHRGWSRLSPTLFNSLERAAERGTLRGFPFWING